MNDNKKSALTDSITHEIFELLSCSEAFESYVDYFFKKFEIEKLLHQLGVTNKRRRYKPVELLKYLIKITVTNRSIYQDYRGEYSKNAFSLRTLYRFLDLKSLDWIRLTTTLAFEVFKSVYDADLDEDVFFIFDDSDYKRPYANYCQGISYQFDHNSKQSYKGYRLCMLSLYWNGYLIPISAVLISSQKPEKILFEEADSDQTRAQAIRERLLRSSANQVMLFQIKAAQTVGFKAQYLLFDSWYTHPRTIDQLQSLGLEVIGMLKTGGTTRFRYEGRFYNLKELFDHLKPINLPYQVEVDAVVRESYKEIFSFPAILTFCENRHKERDYFCLLSSSTGIPTEQIVTYFRYRWSIEQAFKDLKNPNLDLVSGNQSLSLTSMSAYIGVVLIRYMVILIEREYSNMTKERSIQDQYHKTSQESTSIDYANIYYGGIRSGLEQISQDYDIDLDELLLSFSEGSRKNSAFAEEADFIYNSITNPKSDNKADE